MIYLIRSESHTMRVAQEKVREFHEKHDYLCPEKPSLLEGEDIRHRVALMQEELDEYEVAANELDLVEVADGLGDLLYVVLGTCVAHGIDIQAIFDEIHRSNMTKDVLDPVTRKGGKGPNFERPRVAELLLIQTTGL